MVLNYEILSHIKQLLILLANNVVRSKSLAIERIVFQIVSHRKTRSLLLLLAAENTHQITFFCFQKPCSSNSSTSPFVHTLFSLYLLSFNWSKANNVLSVSFDDDGDDHDDGRRSVRKKATHLLALSLIFSAANGSKHGKCKAKHRTARENRGIPPISKPRQNRRNGYGYMEILEFLFIFLNVYLWRVAGSFSCGDRPENYSFYCELYETFSKLNVC